jgi:hypothetical protein
MYVFAGICGYGGGFSDLFLMSAMLVVHLTSILYPDNI